MELLLSRYHILFISCCKNRILSLQAEPHGMPEEINGHLEHGVSEQYQCGVSATHDNVSFFFF